MTGLRTIWGVSFESVEYNFDPSFLRHLKMASEKFINQELLEINYGHDEHSQGILKTTQKGKFLVDGIAAELFMI
jgi:oxygen-independent coproporphyrinogen-3 oxidase